MAKNDNNLQFNVKASDGNQIFPTPRITIVSGGVVKEVPDNLALLVGYAIQALVNGDSALSAKTKVNAGVDILEAVKALPKDSTLTLYMPTTDDKRDSKELKDWSPCVTVKSIDLEKTCTAMAQIAKIRDSFVATVSDYTVTQPVYFTGVTVGKTRGGKKNITSLF